MSAIRIKPYVLRLYLAVLILFVLNKFVVRPFVLDHDLPAFLRMIVLSIPNTFEAILGMGNVAALLMAAKLYLSPRFDQIPDPALYLLTTALVTTYVVTQEFEIHDLGGRNTYDPNDVAASVLGVVVMLPMLWRFGVLDRVDSSPAPDSGF